MSPHTLMCADEALRHCQRETRHQCLCSTHVNNCSRKQSAGTARLLGAGPTPYGVGPAQRKRAVPYGSCCTRPGWVVHLTVTSSGHTRRCRDAWMSQRPSDCLFWLPQTLTSSVIVCVSLLHLLEHVRSLNLH